MPLRNPFSRRTARGPQLTTEPQPDAHPKTGLFTEPVRVADLQVLEPETLEDGRTRVTFLVEVRDAEGRRCPDLAVEATVTGPERTRTVQGTTDLFGRIRFRMTSTPGAYHLEVTDVAARGLDWDRDAGPAEASTTVL